MQSDHIRIRNTDEDITRVYSILDEYIMDTNIHGRNETRLRLLTEEAIRFARLFSDTEAIEIWLSGDSKVTNIFLETKAELSEQKKKELISLSSTGENGAGGFFGKLVSVFVSVPDTEETWTLGKYKEEMIARRIEDKYAQDAWEDLERSILANLSDNIEVSVRSKKITMVITKIFAQTVENVGVRVPSKVSTPIVLVNDQNFIGRAIERVDAQIKDLELNPKDSIHLRLLFEEAIGMLGAIAGEFESSIWFEKYPDEYCLKIRAKTDMDADKKEQLLAVSTDGKNSMANGVMGKIRDVVENGLLQYEMVQKLQQEYGTGYVDYGTIGMYGNTECMADMGITWSLHEYEVYIEGAKADKEAFQEAWDELEKSIVASITKDVIVGVRSDSFEMTFIADRTEK